MPAQSDFEVEVLLTEPRWIALPAGHRLAGEDRIRFQDLYDEPFVATPAESGAWRDYWLAADEREGHPVRIGAVAHHPDEWLNAIAHGQGISLTPEATARFYQRPDVVYRPVTGVSPSQIGVAWPTPPSATVFLACEWGRPRALGRSSEPRENHIPGIRLVNSHWA